MIESIRRPHISRGKSTEEQVEEIRRYLFYLADELNRLLEQLDSKNGNDNEGG